MKAMRERRKAGGVREVRLRAPDARSEDVRARIAVAVRCLSRRDEDAAMSFIESVADFDDHEAR